MQKLILRTDNLFFRKITVNTDTMADLVIEFSSTLLKVTASPHVIPEDILDEVQEIEDQIELNPKTFMEFAILTTVMREYPDSVLALTYEGFINESKKFAHMLKRDAYKALATQLVTGEKPDYEKENLVK